MLNHQLPRSASLVTRRRALQIGGLGMFGLTLPKILAAEGNAKILRRPAKAKSVVFLYQWGGPSHLETFDMKPDAPDQIRGQHKPMKSSAPGIWVNERLPNMARVMDRVTLIRSMTHTMKNHNSAGYYALTGKAPPVDDIRLRDSIELFPSYGSVMDSFLPKRPDVPNFVALPYTIADGSVTPGQHASFLGKMHDPLLVTEDPNAADFRLPELSLPAGVSPERLQQRRELQALVDRQLRVIDHSVEARNLGRDVMPARCRC